MKIQVGAHLGSEEGLPTVPVLARALGIPVFQTMFGKTTSWSYYKYQGEALEKFRMLTYGMGIYAHLPLSLNPCIPEDDRRHKRQLGATKKYLEFLSDMGVKGAVIHPGYMKDSEEEAFKIAVKFFTYMLDSKILGRSGMKILVETDAGSKKGTKVGSPDFVHRLAEELHPHVKVCIDTEHLWARGYDLWDPVSLDDFIDHYGEYVELVHLNVPDPGIALGSYVDRHNTPIEEFVERSSVDLVRVLTRLWPCILERRSLTVIQQDLDYIDNIV